jgi:ectoine hydroxylase-related dioxygenase (phytanoyl-CoA dioxygenase family)
MQTEFTVSLSFEVYINLEDFNNEAITEQDILNAFGSAEEAVSDHEAAYFIKHCLDAEDIFLAGNIQTAKVVWVKED